MGENTTELPGSGSSLEELLQRRLHRFGGEGHALVDRDEFAAHIAIAFEGSVPEESFVERFFAGNPELAAIVPDLAGAIVATADRRLDVYDFELATSEYLVLEDGDKVVVAGDGGQVEARYDEPVRQAVRAAVIPDRGPARADDRRPAEPRAYLVRQSGAVEALDAGRLASALAPLSLRQVTAPVVDRPARRLVRFSPRARRLSAGAEERVLRENDPRMSFPVSPPRARLSQSERPDSADPAVFVLLPDGTMARPAMGAATRWRQMVSGWTARAALLDVGSPSMRISGDERFSFSGNKLTALVRRPAADGPGDLGARSELRARALAQVRTDLAPVRMLGDDDLAQLVARGGARLVPGWTAALTAESADSFWVQPEGWFAPTAEDRALVMRADRTSGLDAPAAGRDSPQAAPESSGNDPRPTLADTTPKPPASLPTAAPSIPSAAGSVPLAEAAPAQTFVSAPPVASQAAVAAATAPMPAAIAPKVVSVLSPAAPIGVAPSVSPTVAAPRLAPSSPPQATIARPPLKPSLPPQATIPSPRLTPSWPSPAKTAPLAPRTGALPATAYGALQLGIERTAATGAHRLPLPRMALGFERRDASMRLRPSGRLQTVAPLPRLRRVVDADRSARLGRVLASMPFPNASELHVGRDLSDSLRAYVAALVMPEPAPLLPALPRAPAASLHSMALASARRAASGVERAELREFLASRQAASLQMLPRLLRQALRAGGEWAPGPGAAMPSEVAAFAAHRPFQLPQLAVAPAHFEDLTVAPRPGRALGLGEDEIVVPAPLWAEMGRRGVPAAIALMAAPLSRSSYSPPLGSYRTTLPRPLTVFDQVSDSSARHAGFTGSAELGPERASQRLLVPPEGGHFTFAAPVERDAGPRGRPRVRVGAPLDRSAAASQETSLGRSTEPLPSAGVPPRGDRVAAPVTFAARQPLPAAAHPSASLEGPLIAPAPGVRPMTTALQEAERLSRAVSRALVAEPTLIAKKTAPAGTVEPVAMPGTGGGWQSPAADSWVEDERRSTGMDVAGSAPWEYVGTEPLPTVLTTDGAGFARTSPRATSGPMGLRFRYVSAPLWWSPSLRQAASPAPAAFAADVHRSLAAALFASNSAATLWRSILSSAEQPTVDLSGGMDRGHDAPGRELSGVERRLDVLVQLGLIGKAPASHVLPPLARGPETVYVAMDEQGRAGPVRAEQLLNGRTLAQSVDMRVVTALPPSPPPLESMSAMRGIADVAVPRARHPQAKAQEDKADELVSHSKIEGSVEAVAQRIYHRVRRRLASDRERFGG